MEPAGTEVLRHEPAMGGLVGRVGLGQGGPLATGTEQVEVQRLDPVAGGDRPFLVALLGQQLPAVAARELGARRRVGGGQRPPGGLLERDDVDGDLGRRPERDDVAAEDDRVLRTNGLAGQGRRLVEVGPGRFGGEVGPQRVHHLLGAEPALGGEGEECDQLPGAPALPGRAVDDAAIPSHYQTAEEAHLHFHPTSVAPVRMERGGRLRMFGR